MDESLLCIGCNQPLVTLPIYNAKKNKDFPASVLFCQNDKCERNGLLTVVFRYAESERKAV